MTCGRAKELMADAWQGELDRAATSTLNQHLESCADCSAEMALLGTLWGRLGDLPVPEPSQALHIRWESTLESLLPSARKPLRISLWANLWPRNPVWQAAIAMASLVMGVLIGTTVPRHDGEIAKLREEIANTREMVALSLLQQQSATERLKGVNYTGRMQTMEPEVISALIQAVSGDANVNVRLAAIDALSKVAGSARVLRSLAQSLPMQDSPMVQAALIDYLVDAHDRQALGTLRKLALQPDLNPAVRERTHFALQQLSQ
jgi:anti-sigma factor RsiW